MEDIKKIDERAYVLELGNSAAFVNVLSPDDIREVLGNDDSTTPVPVPNLKGYRGFVPWGDDNLRPYKIAKAVQEDEVTVQNAHFNALTLYASGLTVDTEESPENVKQEITDWMTYQRPVKYLLDQCADMKYFFFSVSVVILSVDGTRIVRLIHKEASHCRFESCNPKTGKIEHIFFADWENRKVGDAIEVIPLLDVQSPLADLAERFGRIYGESGVKRSLDKWDKARKFAILNIFPTVGQKYYPFAPWWSIFNSGWLAYKQAIVGRKLDKLTTSRIKYKVDIHPNYFQEIFAAERITSEADKEARRMRELHDIKKFLEGKEASDKVFVSGCYLNQSGEAKPKVQISVVDNKKEGGDLIEDSAEASNMICYAFGVHPSLIGATPGKNNGSFSGSAQRELFTLKQALEKPFQDILLEPFRVIAGFNQWQGAKFDIPVVTLTTLDKGKDAQESSLRDSKNA